MALIYLATQSLLIHLYIAVQANAKWYNITKLIEEIIINKISKRFLPNFLIIFTRAIIKKIKVTKLTNSLLLYLVNQYRSNNLRKI
jgi:hypothetical protein